MKLAVIGTGYVGLVAGVCFAEAGNDVTCVDVNLEKLERLRAGELPIYEPGLEHLFKRNAREERLLFTHDLAGAIKDAEIIFLALPTPPGADGAADLKYVLGASTDIGKLLTSSSTYKIIVTKSTVPVGTADKVRAAIAQHAQSEFDVVSNPEFLREGVAVDDFLKPERVVIGINEGSTDPTRAERLMRDLYHPFLMSGNPLLVMDARSAELTKYAANSMLALRISFMNDIATLCERCGANVDKVRLGVGLDSRIGKRFLFAGTGYGGSCFSGNERLWTRENGALRSRTLRELWETGGEVTHDKACDWKTPQLDILAFDCEKGEAIIAPVQALTKRRYAGAMVNFKTAMGRTLRVTPDHPVIVREDGELAMRLAATIKAGDELLLCTALPTENAPETLDLTSILPEELNSISHIRCQDGHFSAQYASYKTSAKEFLKYPEEIKFGNRMPLHLWKTLRERGELVSTSPQVQLYSAKGAATYLNAHIPLDTDFFRLIGYFLAEGFIHCETGRPNSRGSHALRERIGWSFGEHEPIYIADLRRILQAWGLKWMESRGPGAVTTVVSSRHLAFLIRDYLNCGTRSENKALPRHVLEAAPELKLELLRGAFSGDGSLTLLQNGRNAMLEYATVSRSLADGLCLLLQSVGIVASVKARRMNKSTQDAFILRVNGKNQLAALRDVFGPVRRAKIDEIIDGYQRTIKQRGFDLHERFASVKIQSVIWDEGEVSGEVFSLESATGTAIIGSGIVAHNCFPKDVQALVATGREFGAPQSLLEATESINQRQKKTLLPRMEAHFDGDLTGRTFAMWGLAFKPNTDDIREAPALVLIEELLERGAQVVAYDPEAMDAVERTYGSKFGDRLRFGKRHYDVCEGADALVIVTEWPKFREPDFAFLHEMLNYPVIFDGRNVYDLETMHDKGFTYYSIGRPTIHSTANVKEEVA
ncbi:UDP-glucose 6-dehydrogenase TuaD [Abditibacteriota bacterium]|nr:UDP-glucose 6-dehydrogenase TuaD [Abditibacteriota bacterium]